MACQMGRIAPSLAFRASMRRFALSTGKGRRRNFSFWGTSDLASIRTFFGVFGDAVLFEVQSGRRCFLGCGLVLLAGSERAVAANSMSDVFPSLRLPFVCLANSYCFPQAAYLVPLRSSRRRRRAGRFPPAAAGPSSRTTDQSPSRASTTHAAGPPTCAPPPPPPCAWPPGRPAPPTAVPNAAAASPCRGVPTRTAHIAPAASAASDRRSW